MQATQRRIGTGVIGRLLDTPYRFEFFQAVRMLERWLGEHGAHGPEGALARQLRFRNTLSLAFPASELEAIAVRAQGESEAPAELARATFEIVPAFLGLLGVQGALPLHYTEQIAAREHALREQSARAFLDIFTNRSAALFYRAWKKYRLALHDESAREHRYLPMLLALGGVAGTSARDVLRGAISDAAVAGCASAARHRPMSAAYLARMLSHYFDVPFEVEQFVGKWYDLTAEQLTVPGRANALLGRTSRIGRRVWLRDQVVRLRIGPLSQREHEDFLPGGSHAAALERLLLLLAGATLEYEVLLILKRDDVHPMILNRSGRLARQAFLCTRAAQADRPTTRYRLHAAASASTHTRHQTDR